MRYISNNSFLKFIFFVRWVQIDEPGDLREFRSVRHAMMRTQICTFFSMLNRISHISFKVFILNQIRRKMSSHLKNYEKNNFKFKFIKLNFLFGEIAGFFTGYCPRIVDINSVQGFFVFFPMFRFSIQCDI